MGLISCDCKLNGFKTSTLPDGTVGTHYSTNLDVDHGECSPEKKEFTIISGSLPNGVSFSSNGHLGGTPTNTGTFNLTVKAEVCFDTDINNQ
jgi:hypothetical protein